MVFCKDCKHKVELSRRYLQFNMFTNKFFPFICYHPQCFVDGEMNAVTGVIPRIWHKDISDLNANYDCKLFEKKSPWWKFWLAKIKP